MEWTPELEKTLDVLLEDYAREYWNSDQGVGVYDPEGRKRLVIEFVKGLLQGQPREVMYLRYEVLIAPDPAYQEGKPGLKETYTVVRIIGNRPPEIIKVFDRTYGDRNYAQYRDTNLLRDRAYEMAAELTEAAQR